MARTRGSMWAFISKAAHTIMATPKTRSVSMAHRISALCTARTQLRYTAHFRLSFLFSLHLFAQVALIGSASAKDEVQTPAALTQRLAAGLSDVAHNEITSQQEFCLSKHRPVLIGSEVSALIAQALRNSSSLRIRGVCRPVSSEGGWQDCRLYFYSPNPREPWTAGLSFLARPQTGAIRSETVECFATP